MPDAVAEIAADRHQRDERRRYAPRPICRASADLIETRFGKSSPLHAQP
jgi:hypothetical protein